MADIIGTLSNEHLNGGSGSDTIDGLEGNDRINAGSGNDTVDGGSGSDDVKGDSGNDLLIYEAAENAGATDIYDGGSHIDTLRLVLTREEWMRDDVQADIAAYLAFIAAETNPANGQASNREFRFTAFDLRVSKVELLEVTVLDSNSPPVITSGPADTRGSVVESGYNDDGSVMAGMPNADGLLTALDPDPDTILLSWSGSANGTFGSFTLPSSKTGQWSYTLDNNRAATQELREGQSVTEAFTVTVSDDEGGTATQLVTITIHGTNDKPLITSGTSAAQGDVIEAGHLDNGTIAPGTPIAAGMLTASDVDAGAVLSWSGSADGTYGSFAIDPSSGVWTYTLDNSRPATQALHEGQSVTDTFTATVTDEFGASVTQLVTVTVAGANDKPAITSGSAQAAGSVGEAGHLDDGFVNAGVPIVSRTLTASDVDAGAVLSWSGNANGIYGNFVIDSVTGEWIYTLDNNRAATQALNEGQSVTESFTATVTDDKGATATQTVTVTINGYNDQPTVGAVFAVVSEDGTLTVIPLAGNDVDADDGQPTLTYFMTGGPAAGFAVIVGSSLLFDPGDSFQHLAAGQTQQVTVTYSAIDSHFAVSQGQGPIQVMALYDLADISGMLFLAPETVAAGIIASPLTAFGVFGPTFSNHFLFPGWDPFLNPGKFLEVSINPLGNVIDFETVRFSVENTGGAEPSTWFLRSSADGFTSNIAAGTTTGFSVTDYTVNLGNLALVSGPITFRWYFTAPSSSGSTGFANHEPTVGQDLVFTGKFITGTSAAVTITVVGVNDAPVAANDSVSIAENDAALIDVLANDSDPDAGTILSIKPGSLVATNGTAVISGGKILFAPDTDFTGVATVSYVATDGSLDSAPATVDIFVG